jgi:ATP-dependent DNA helicase RecQ
MTDPASDARRPPPFQPRCVSIDLEVGVNDGRIHRFAAVRGDTGETLIFRGGNLAAALRELDALAAGASFILGHNIIAFDVPHLIAVQPGLEVLKLPAVDTLRLNPLAFPRNPYHHLVKHYQDGQLKSGRLNDPELDARLTLDVLRDQHRALKAAHASAPDLVCAWHWLTTTEAAGMGLDSFFATVRHQPRPRDEDAARAIQRRLAGNACSTCAGEVIASAGRLAWPLSYALAWLSVAGGNSVMPPWVRHQFPDAGALVRRLRDTPCSDPACAWCRDRHSPEAELERWFRFSAFRPDPVGDDGRPLQRAIVEAAMRGRHVLGILPTGTGKSLCYQLPALSRFDKLGALTVVISPLVALMADQVAGLERSGITSCAALNGLLSMPERADVLDRVRLGDVGILIVSPEQLRNRTFRKTLAQREIGAWVLDEAHCLSKWGHDFRPDYRYVGRFIREKAGAGAIPPILCLTATAKPDVVTDILDYFHGSLGVELAVFNGGSERTNLDFAVVPTTEPEKLAHVHQVLSEYLPEEVAGGAIVYCATRRQTEDVKQFLVDKGVAADRFHAALKPEEKKTIQERFIRGDLRVIAATNAFGMGIDKPDVRLVVHSDIPGSLENYLQEAGRAGRDRAQARCVLLYTPEDVERQFGMSARSRLTQREIQAILRALRRLDHSRHGKGGEGEVVATSGEIVAAEEQGVYEPDSATDDTRVRTAISWLEEAKLVSREENRVQIFPSSLRVATLADARAKLAAKPMQPRYRDQLLHVVEALMNASADEGISTDELIGASGLTSEEVRRALYDLEALGIASNDTALTAYVHVGVDRSSHKRLDEAVALEDGLIDLMRESAPDLDKGAESILHLRRTTQCLKDRGHQRVLPEHVFRLLRSLAADGRGEADAGGSLKLRRLDAEAVQVTLQREWTALQKTAKLRQAAGRILLDHLTGRVPAGARGTDLLAETTLGKLLSALDADLALQAVAKDLSKLLDRALLWLHEQEVIRLNKGLAVFRPAMTIHLARGKRGFYKTDFEPLKLHYQEQVLQIHVMAEYAQRGLRAVADAVRLAADYFILSREDFIRRWLPDKGKDLSRQTTPESWRSIVENLRNAAQQRVVTDDRENTNVLVLAGPGSGKTRVLVHRIAYLVRVRRENPRGILALAYNRHAAVEIRQRLSALVGDDARGVTVLTCHALAMRLTGASFADRAPTDEDFKRVLERAVALLRGAGLPPEEADEQRDRLLAGFRWILVDEYQDVGPEQYALISALAGRTLGDTDRTLSLFAVGDDDQNIYAFQGASVEFIRRFEADYSAKPAFLVENYRSTGHIIAAANRVIEGARQRMKAGEPIVVDAARRKLPPGGIWAEVDPAGKGRVQVLPVGRNALTQAIAVMTELQRLSGLRPGWDWSRCAVIAREWRLLEPVRAYCELNGIPVQMADEHPPKFWRLRETQALLGWLDGSGTRLLDGPKLREWLMRQSLNPWWDMLREALAEYLLETHNAELPAGHFREWLAEWGQEARRRQTGVLLTTAHRAKGLEFEHVAVLDGGWDNLGKDEDPDAPRRLLYVAMTRARQTLTLGCFEAKPGNPYIACLKNLPDAFVRDAIDLPTPSDDLRHAYLRVSLRDVDLGFAGRYASEHPVHRRIAGLVVDDELLLKREKDLCVVQNARGQIVGRLAKAFQPPAGKRFVSGKVSAVLVWKREDSEPEYASYLKCGQWEVVVPELVFGPPS